MAIRTTGAARFLTEQKLGGPTRESETNPTATTTVSTIVKANPDRVGLVVMNLGSNDVFVALNNGVSSTNGIRLTQNGGVMTLNVNDDATLVAREWDGLTTVGSSLVYVLELISDVLVLPEQK